jgi:hypothetical protein
MAIDYVIDYDCIPKAHLTTEGIVERLKGLERAQEIIRLFRRNGDERPPGEMGFEFTRSTPTGEEEKRVIVVQDLLDEAAALDAHAHHCVGCPANRTGARFGCVGFVQYPISAEAERWALDRMPVPDDTLVWMLLKQGVREFSYDGESIKPLREVTDAYFASSEAQSRKLGEFSVDANQLFEMMFAVGNINPNHAAMLLLFLGAIRRDLEADEIMAIAPAPEDAEARYPFVLTPREGDDPTVAEIKEFLAALHLAWRLKARVLVDA